MVGDGEHYVYLNLKSANDDLVSDDDPFVTNKIALKCENISISTTKNVMALPLPFSGIATGESTSLALDFGVASKNISLSGIITEQEIVKKFKGSNFTDATLTRPAEGIDSSGKNDNTITITMTADEIAQLIHSSVDSSFLQQHQNYSSLTILIPSRVNRNYQYHTNAAPGESLLLTKLEEEGPMMFMMLPHFNLEHFQIQLVVTTLKKELQDLLEVFLLI